MPQNNDIKKVLVIGSGPIIIGQAAEFDYAGTQACKALREEGVEVILVNSNPATIMTDLEMADKVYIEPLTIEFISRIIKKERPDGLLPTLGGQTALNLALELSQKGIIEKYNLKLLGTPLLAIQKAEDRDMFKNTMQELDQPVPESIIASSMEQSFAFVKDIGFPVIIRPAYTLGGTGGGIAENEEELRETVARGLKSSPIGQILLEKSVAGWKEVEYEVMRDSADNCITVCNMENFDPVGIHTGDSIVVAPTQTLANKEFEMLRQASLAIIRALEIEGGCNIQFALDTDSMNYYVIEVNPRVSRSSALASKATGYPIAKVASKIAIGLTLDEIDNEVTGKTSACFEPTLDYVVVKIPRWPFDKFVTASRELGTQMKATGEVMALERTLEGALQKAIRSLEIGEEGVYKKELETVPEKVIYSKITKANDERIFYLFEAILRGDSLEKINTLTGIDLFFLNKLKKIADFVNMARKKKALNKDEYKEAKQLGFSDKSLSEIMPSLSPQTIYKERKKLDVMPVYKMVDTCGGEFEAETPYYYSTYEEEDEVEVTENEKVLVLGSGPIRIGQGIEFDYCSVHCVKALKELGKEAIIINNNPETVSTDFDCADKLYFEPLVIEDVMHVIDKEQPQGVMVQFGGQTAINLGEDLAKRGVKILGTSIASIDLAEDRDKCSQLLKEIGVVQPPGASVYTHEEAMGIAGKLGFPLIVRPSYVIGGRSMQIVYNESDLISYIKQAVFLSSSRPVLIDKYILGKEVEVDAVSDGEDILIPGIMEHIERAGVHSGDSMTSFPPHTLTDKQKQTIIEYTRLIAKEMQIKGLLNIQMVIYKGKVYVLEVNPRASRTIPIFSKITGIPLVNIATRVMLGEKLKDMDYGIGLYQEPDFYSIKAPVFSFEKLNQVDISLGPEMKSTGEVLGIDHDYTTALYKAFLASGFKFPAGQGTVLVSVSDSDKNEMYPIIKDFKEIGFKIYATRGTADYLAEKGLLVERVLKVGEGLPNVLELVRSGEIDIVVNTPSAGKLMTSTGHRLRRFCVEYKVPCLTSYDTAWALLAVIKDIALGNINFNINSINNLLGVK